MWLYYHKNNLGLVFEMSDPRCWQRDALQNIEKVLRILARILLFSCLYRNHNLLLKNFYLSFFCQLHEKCCFNWFRRQNEELFWNIVECNIFILTSHSLKRNFSGIISCAGIYIRNILNSTDPYLKNGKSLFK